MKIYIYMDDIFFNFFEKNKYEYVEIYPIEITIGGLNSVLSLFFVLLLFF
jgi:hypothetical protein